MTYPEQRRYESNLSVQQLSDAVRELLHEIQANNSPVADEAREHVDSDTLRELLADDDGIVQIHRDSAGLGAADTTIIITLTAKIIKDLWDYVLLPRIRQRWGDESLALAKKE